MFNSQKGTDNLNRILFGSVKLSKASKVLAKCANSSCRFEQNVTTDWHQLRALNSFANRVYRHCLTGTEQNISFRNYSNGIYHLNSCETRFCWQSAITFICS